jgi:hypothetical protein
VPTLPRPDQHHVVGVHAEDLAAVAGQPGLDQAVDDRRR